MKDEIKEIDNSDLMELLETTSKKEFYRLTLDHELVVRLYNWITNSRESEAYYYGQYKDYKSRNEKAIEMFNNETLNKYYYGMSYEFEINDFKEDMLNILQGSDKE